jgi:hypothetical protein
MRRTLDSARFDAMANSPDVRPWLGGDGPVSTITLVSDPANFCFLSDDEMGGYIYKRLATGLYEVHTLSLPEGRGRPMLRARGESLRKMFVETDAIEIVTTVPEGNAGADIWAKHAGFREVYSRPWAWQLNGASVTASYRSLAYQDWVFKDRENHALGYEFHEQIHRFTSDDHGIDLTHDFYVGATLAGIRAGNTTKALGLYNRWAAHAGYEPCRCVSLNPVVLDFRSAVVQITETGLQVLQVRPTQSVPSKVEDEGDASFQLALQSEPRAR